MLLFSIGVAIAIARVGNAWTASLCLNETNVTSFTNDTGRLPTVNLGYTIQQATSFNASNGYYTFSNIRYGDPPTGQLRFAAPKAASTNRTLQTGNDVDRRCYQANPGWTAISTIFVSRYLLGQTNSFYAQYPSQASFPSVSLPPADPAETEDCLFLDVKVPASSILNQKAKNYRAPVLVWIHGGGYTVGYKSQYSADSLLTRSRTSSDNGIIFVQINYRLGAFGFLAGKDAQPNAGLLDQRLALQWVQRHIGQFGGDPKKVTVIGESAGGGSIEQYLTSRDAASTKYPLFQQAILQSPYVLPDPGQAQNQATYQKFLLLVGSPSLAAAKNAPAEALRRANYQVALDAPYGQFGFGPIIDNSYLSASPATQLLAGHYQKPLAQILGQNSAEGIIFTDPWIFENDAFKAFVQRTFPAAPPDTISYITDTIYPPPSDAGLLYKTNLDRAALFTSEAIFTCNNYLLALAYENQSYNYLFDVPPGLHGQDLNYTFGPTPYTKSEEIRVTLQDYLTSFTVKGDPNRPGQPNFPLYGSENQVLDLAPGAIALIPDPVASKRCLALQKGVWN